MFIVHALFRVLTSSCVDCILVIEDRSVWLGDACRVLDDCLSSVDFVGTRRTRLKGIHGMTLLTHTELVLELQKYVLCNSLCLITFLLISVLNQLT